MKSKNRKSSKFVFKFLIIAFIIMITLGVLIAFPAIATYKSGMKTYNQAKLIINAMKAQNIALASEELSKTKSDLKETRKNFDSMFFIRYVPVLNFYYNDVDHVLSASDKALDSAAIVIDSIKPYADVLGLKGAGSFVSGSAEDRIKTAVMTMGKITPKIDTIAKSLLLIRKEIDGINPAHYPTIIFGNKPKSELTKLRNLTDQGVELIDQARPLIKLLPSLLGESEPKKYLILFQNNKELRPTGGFITAYSIMNIDKGKLTVERSDDIYTLDDTIGNKPTAPTPLRKYLEVSVLNLRDSNLSPDFISSMDTFMNLYNRAGARVNVDGIIAIDTNVLVSTIKILDDQVTASDVTFTTKNNPNCNCPDVIYLLEDNISRPVNHFRPERKGLIGSLMYSIMDKAFKVSPKLYWGPLFQTMLAETNQKHILFYLFDKDAQKGIEAVSAAGRIIDFDGDYLHVNDANLGGQKANLFTKENVVNDYTVNSDGSIQKTVTITYKNTFPPDNCSLEAGLLCLNAPLRNWLRVYVPKGSQLIDSKGSEVKLTTYDELNKTVFDGFLVVRTLGQAKFSVTYKLPFKLSPGSPLPFFIQKQSGTDGNEYKIVINGKTVEEFPLFADKKMQIKI
jgi:hypothetical protein